jgi:hypothetical protein
LRIVAVPDSEPGAKPVFPEELVHEIAAEIAVRLRHQTTAAHGQNAGALSRPRCA